MNLPFDTLPCADYIKELSADITPVAVREAQAVHGVPCLSEMGCRLLALAAAMKQPQTMIDIGCGIGASTLALASGAPNAHITALDANEGRAALCKEFTAGHNVTVHCANALNWLRDTEERFDLAFVDSIKKDYAAVWYLLRPKLNAGAVVIFDDVLLHGYSAEPQALIPMKYRDGAAELRLFLDEMSKLPDVISQILPLGGGMLMCCLR
jgi:predicted O-methyltransferase YrrM